MRRGRGQSILEYTIIIGIVTVVLFYMGTSIKRGVQSMVKITADQVGPQANADQDFNDTQQGYVAASNTFVQQYQSDQVTETGYISTSGNAVYLGNRIFDESNATQTNVITNAGFVQSNL